MMEKIKNKKIHIAAVLGVAVAGVVLFQGVPPKEAQEPKIDSLSPAQGPAGTEVTIIGQGFSTPADIVNSKITGTKTKGENIVSAGNYVLVRDQIAAGPLISADGKNLSFIFDTASLKMSDDCVKGKEDNNGCDLPIKIVNAFGRRTNDKNFRLTQAAVSAQPPAETNKKYLLFVTNPTGGYGFVRGTTIPINWQFTLIKGNVPRPTNMDVDLLKGGVFYRKIASGVSFDPALYFGSISWKIPTDIAPGGDYTIAVYDSSSKKPAMYDAVDKPFSILGNTITIKGKIIDGSTHTPLPWVKAFHGTDSSQNQLVYDTATGDFSLSFSPNPDVAAFSGYFNWEFPWQTPTCYMPYTQIDAHYFPNFNPSAGVTGVAPYIVQTTNMNSFDTWVLAMNYRIQKRIPILGDTVDAGEIDVYPVTEIRVFSDIPTKFGLEYANLPNPTDPSGVVIPQFEAPELANLHDRGGQFPVGYSTRVALGDKDGKVYYAPWFTAPGTTACKEQVLTFWKGEFKWQPYQFTYNTWALNQSWKAGDKVTGSMPSLKGGTAPYKWSVFYGTLPPGVSLSDNGAVSGTTTAAGKYEIGFAATDAAGVSMVVPFMLIVQ